MKKYLFVVVVLLVVLTGCSSIKKMQVENVKDELLERLQENMPEEYGIAYYNGGGGVGRSQIVKELRYQINDDKVMLFNAQTINEIYHDENPEVYCYQKDDLAAESYSCECVYIDMDEGKRETKPCTESEKIDHAEGLTINKVKEIAAESIQGWSNIAQDVNGTVECYADKVYISEQMHFTKEQKICFDQDSFKSFHKSEYSGPYGSLERWERIPLPIQLIKQIVSK